MRRYILLSGELPWADEDTGDDRDQYEHAAEGEEAGGVQGEDGGEAGGETTIRVHDAGVTVRIMDSRQMYYLNSHP